VVFLSICHDAFHDVLHVHRLPGRDHQLNDDLKDVAAAIKSL
jgi:hypothetical protein